MNNDGLLAIAEVIKSKGFDTLSQEFLARPDDRDKIVTVMTRTIEREDGHAKARRFAALAGNILHGTQIFA